MEAIAIESAILFIIGDTPGLSYFGESGCMIEMRTVKLLTFLV